jgi:transcriptional regulator with XRE-family HTH domain
MAKLSADEWIKARAKWERSKTLSFEALAKDLGVSRPAVSNRAKAENWTRKVTGNTEKVTAKVTHEVTGALNVENQENNGNSSTVTVESGKYKESYNQLAYGLSLAGLTLEEIADSIGVHVTTIRDWRKRYPDFNNAFIGGREIADSEVGISFFELATGKRNIIEKKQVLNQVTGEINTLITERTVLPNVKALIHWMFNRNIIKDYWSNGEGKNNNVILELDAKEVIEAFNEAMEKAREKYGSVMENRRLRQGITIDADYSE